MGDRKLELRVLGVPVVVDCAFADQVIQDGTYVFGGIRELYINNCYLRAPAWVPGDRPKVVVDLGANRGLFSTLMAGVAERVVAVEANSDFRPVIERNLSVNSHTNVVVETAFLGSGGMFDRTDMRHLSMQDLITGHAIETIDLLKMDVEGSEFSLFADPGWLAHVRALTMEIHGEYGSVEQVVTTLRDMGFHASCGTASLETTRDLHLTTYVWARRPDSPIQGTGTSGLR
jgi:hypothetical protein